MVFKSDKEHSEGQYMILSLYLGYLHCNNIYYAYNE